jgi:cytochrome c553
MKPVADNMSEEDMRAVAAFLEAFPADRTARIDDQSTAHD